MIRSGIVQFEQEQRMKECQREHEATAARVAPLDALGDEDIPAPQCAAKLVLERRT